MASAAHGLRLSGAGFSSSVEPSNCCRNARTSDVLCRRVWEGRCQGQLRLRFLGWSDRKSRRKRQGSWHCLQAQMQHVLFDDQHDERGDVGKTRSTATDVASVPQNGRRATHGVVHKESNVAEPRSAEDLVASEVGTSGRPRKSGSSTPHGRKQKRSPKTPKDGDYTNSQVDGFLSEFSDNDVGTDVEDTEDDAGGFEFTVGRSIHGQESTGEKSNTASSNGDARISGDTDEGSSKGDETDLRFMFLEAIMERARNYDVEGVEEAMSEMAIAGLQAGPRAYHGLVVAYTRAGDPEGALQALRKEFTAGAKPLPETFVALARLFGSKGQPQRGEEILAAMEKLNHDPRGAWLVLVEELLKAGYLPEANEVFLKGAEGGLRGTNELYDKLVEEDCKVGDHSNAVSILRVMEYSGRMSTTSHYNCLLMAQANAGVPEITAMTFETMQYGRDEMKPDTDSYNWLIQAHTRHKFGDRCQEVIDLLGEMVEDYKRVQPNMKTYALLVECFTKYDHINEAVRHFRAMAKLPGSTTFLYNEGHGKESDPLSLYLRALSLEGRAGDLLEALEAMTRDSQPLPPRALLVNRKGRTLVSTWIDPLQQEADLGFEVDYVARFLAEGGGVGTRKRWSSSADGERVKDPDDDGFAYAAPVEVSYKGFLTQMRRVHNLRLIRKLRLEGVHALGQGATEADVQRVMERLVRETLGDTGYQVKKPKAASKMLVLELKEELDAQNLPTEGTRPVLYQRVQKARRINRSRGRPLWVPPSEEEGEERNDEELDIFMERLNLRNENSEFWRKRFTGEDVLDGEESLTRASSDTDDDTFDDDDEDEEDEDVEVEEEVDDLVEDGGEVEEGEPPEMLAMQLLKNKKDVPEKVVIKEQQRREGEWLGLTLEEKVTMLKTDRRLDASELYTITDVWGWTWERELREQEPEPWSQEKEVQLGIEIMLKVQALGGVPTIGDMGTLVHAAMRTPWAEALISLLQHSHKLGYVFGSKLYSRAISLCLSLGEKDAAINIIAGMDEVGVSAPEELVADVLRLTDDEEKLEKL